MNTKRRKKDINIIKMELTILIIKSIKFEIFKLTILYQFKNLEKKYIKIKNKTKHF